MAEGARFELADELPHLRFSRPARSAAPSPLQTALRVGRRLIIVLSYNRRRINTSSILILARPGDYASHLAMESSDKIPLMSMVFLEELRVYIQPAFDATVTYPSSSPIHWPAVAKRDPAANDTVHEPESDQRDW
jgi:hypothetical protein